MTAAAWQLFIADKRWALIRTAAMNPGRRAEQLQQKIGQFLNGFLLHLITFVFPIPSARLCEITLICCFP